MWRAWVKALVLLAASMATAEDAKPSPKPGVTEAKAQFSEKAPFCPSGTGN